MYHYFKSAKIFVFFAVLFFVAKPFLGFSMFNRLHPPAVESIFVKVFAKRKLEERESNKVSTETIKKTLADAAQQFVLRFAFLLNILFPVIFLAGIYINKWALRKLRLSLAPAEPSWILNRKLIIWFFE